ncbi:MAG: permease [Gemmatimonadetes bacterium]|nr:permease [Gemmatimonadota bacterium]
MPVALLRACLPRAERDELLADLLKEHAVLAASAGRGVAGQWLWRQALHSAPSLLGWSWRRSITGFEPRANTYQPGGFMLKTFFADARYAARRLRARRTYTLLSVVTLALGIGGTTAVFGVARPLIFDPLPYANADEVVTFWMPGWWTEEEFLYLRDKFTGFRAVGAYRPGDVTMRQDDGTMRLLPGRTVTSELFDVLGAKPLLGRSFQTGDDVQGAEPIAVISYGLWQELGGKPSILGQRITLDDTPRTVVGVMPRGFWFPDPAVRIWLPKVLDPAGRNGNYELVGRVGPGENVNNMATPLSRLTTVMHERFQYSAKADKTREPKVIPLRERLLGSMRPAVVATFAAMALILLIACANVAALMLGQVEGRATEMAVRTALGASRVRLVQQIVVEALIVGMAAGIAGALIAAAGFRLLATALPIGVWGKSTMFDWTMFVVALAISLGTVLLVVFVPAVSLWRGDLRGAMGSARTGGIQGRGGRLEQGLVIMEVALAMLIVSGAALLVRSVSRLYDINPGIETPGIAVIDVLSSGQMTGVARRQKIEEVRAALAELPGVHSAAAAIKLPLRGKGDSFNITIEGRENEPSSYTYFRVATADYFKTMGIHLKSGRIFGLSDKSDTTGGPVVINEALAKKYFPGEDPVGKRIMGGFRGTWQVIGVVANVAEAALTDDEEPVRYYLGDRTFWMGSNASFVVRTSNDAVAIGMLDVMRRTVGRMAPDFAVEESTTMSRVFDAAVGPARQIMALLAILSALALVLGAIGIYGVISHFAARRKRDWAIRVALGLPGSRVVQHIVGQGTALVAVGVAFGAVGTVALSRLLTSFLYGVSSVDPVAFAAAASILLVIGAMAAFIPAHRAGSVDPALVLREQ